MNRGSGGTLGEADGARVVELERRLGIPLSDRACALAALTHKSYVNEHRDEARTDNERLEFLGDAVVDLAVSHRLMERFPGAQEGELSKLRAAIVNEESLVAVARTVGLGDLLLLGRGEAMSGGRDKPSLLADCIEAVIGAAYLCAGLPAVLELVDRLFADALDRVQGAVGRDYKTQVQELAQSRLKASPRYRVVSEQGPDHSKTFSVEIELEGVCIGRGEGRSKKDAEQAAARQGLQTLMARRSEPAQGPSNSGG
jgi:ribonuclease-3